jgi:rubrerythrin
MVEKMPEISISKEILEMAIEIEKNGRAFYESMAKLAKESKVWDTYTYLAAQEQEHENTFREMLSRLGGYQPPQAYSGEHYQYIKALSDSSIFVGERVQVALTQEAVSDAEALEIGIGFEKDSILFYSEIRGLVPPADQEIVGKMIDEEQHHLKQLTEIRSTLKS